MNHPDSPLLNHLDYRLIFDAASNGMAFTCATTGQIIDVNEAWVQTIGIARSAAIGKTAFELGIWANPDERDACLAELDRCGRLAQIEVQLVTHNGVVPHLISGRFVDANENPRVLWELQNLSAQHANAKKLAESEALLKTISVCCPER
jgi:PAS domain S-box-containing protein